MTVIPTEPVWGIVVGLVIVALLVLILPFKIKTIEHNLELFSLVMGVLAVTISAQWSLELIIDALKAPVMIGSLPIGIFQVVLIFGLLLYFFDRQFNRFVLAIATKTSMSIFIFILILVTGLISSVISVIITSVLLAETVSALPLNRQGRIRLIVIACFAVGLGAILTPLGEPMSTILVQKLSGPPYNAGFTFPFNHFAIYVIPGIIAFALFGAIWIGRKYKAGKLIDSSAADLTKESLHSENITSVIIRAVKVFAFVAALVFLGEGLKPLVTWFLNSLPASALYWINSISALLDNATMTAIEINPGMAISQITAIGMSLLIAGGMLIPGNIPNIVAAGRLKISMREWAIIGVPIGLVTMVIYFVALLPIIFK
jgi:predicted cation transporter